MFLIYYIISILAHYVKRILPSLQGRGWGWVLWVSVWLLSIAAYETLYLPKLFSYHKAPFFAYSSLVQTIRFMQFFLLGNIVHRYWEKIQKLFDSVWFFPLVATLAVICCADIFRWHTLKFALTNLPRTTAMYSLLLMVVMFFRYNKKWFTIEHPLGRALQYTGQRTLDVYLLHFLLIPSMPFIGKWLNAHHPNFLIDLLLSVGVALPIVAMCLLISHLLHTSKPLGKFLFGK
jgi:hypothetical protein